MAEWQGASGAVGTSVERVVRALAGRQPYHLDVPGTESAQALSVVSFEAIERLGEPYRITIELTHPDELVRADYLGKDATFSIDSDDGCEPRKFCGCITGFSKLKATADFTAYQIVVEAHVARLRIVRNTSSNTRPVPRSLKRSCAGTASRATSSASSCAARAIARTRFASSTTARIGITSRS